MQRIVAIATIAVVLATGWAGKTATVTPRRASPPPAAEFRTLTRDDWVAIPPLRCLAFLSAILIAHTGCDLTADDIDRTMLETVSKSHICIRCSSGVPRMAPRVHSTQAA